MSSVASDHEQSKTQNIMSPCSFAVELQDSSFDCVFIHFTTAPISLKTILNEFRARESIFSLSPVFHASCLSSVLLSLFGFFLFVFFYHLAFFAYGFEYVSFLFLLPSHLCISLIPSHTGHPPLFLLRLFRVLCSPGRQYLHHDLPNEG